MVFVLKIVNWVGPYIGNGVLALVDPGSLVLDLLTVLFDKFAALVDVYIVLHVDRSEQLLQRLSY